MKNSVDSCVVDIQCDVSGGSLPGRPRVCECLTNHHLSFRRTAHLNVHFIRRVSHYKLSKTWTHNHSDQFFNVKVQAASWNELWDPDSSRLALFEPGSIWFLSFPWQELCPSLRWAPDFPPRQVDGRLQIGGMWRRGPRRRHRSLSCHPASYAARRPARYPEPCLNEPAELSLRSSCPWIHFTLFIYSLSLVLL